MKFVCVQNKLQKALSQAVHTSAKNQELKVLSCFVISAEKNKIVIQTTNIEVGTQIEVPAKVTEEGIVAIPTDVFLKVVSSKTSDLDSIECSLKNGNLLITTKQNSATIKAIPHDDFPTMPYITDGSLLSLPKEDLLGGIKAVSFCAARSNIKPELSSVYMFSENKYLTFVATDGFRLAEKKLNRALQIEEDFSILLPISSAETVLKVLEGVNDSTDVTMSYSDNQISFSTEDTFVTTRLVSGNFPDYRQLIPKEKNTSAIVLKNDIIETLKLVSVFTDSFNEVTIECKPKEKLFAFYTQNKEVGQNQSSLPAVLEGDDLLIKFNHRYINDVLPSITTDSLECAFIESNRPLKIETVPNTGFTYIVMPLNK